MLLDILNQQTNPEHVVLSDISNFVMLVQERKVNYELFVHRFIFLYKAFKCIEDDELKYSSNIQIFKIACLNVDKYINYQDISFLCQLKYNELDEVIAVFNNYSNLREMEKINESEQFQDNINSVLTYIDLLLKHYSRLLIVRVDLGYVKLAFGECDIKKFDLDIKKYRQYIGKRRKCFSGIHGYIWTLEQGVSRGYHCHLMLIYDGSLHNNGWYWASQAGKLWQEITEQRGSFFNCHDAEYMKKFQKIDKCGLGIVHRDDIAMQNNVKSAAVYLAKNEQHLLVKLPSMRTFGTGQFDIKLRRGVQKTLKVVGKLNSSQDVLNQ